MKKISTAVLIAAIGLGLGGCRSSEANYRAAYEKAKNKQDSWDGIEGTVYEAIRREVVPSELLFNGVNIPAKKVRVKAVDAKELGNRYLVVAQFKQLFNARSMCKRLQEAGYGEAVLLKTAEPLYYVAIAQVDTDEKAVGEYLDFKQKKPIGVKESFPWVLIVIK